MDRENSIRKMAWIKQIALPRLKKLNGRSGVLLLRDYHPLSPRVRGFLLVIGVACTVLAACIVNAANSKRDIPAELFGREVRLKSYRYAYTPRETRLALQEGTEPYDPSDLAASASKEFETEIENRQFSSLVAVIRHFESFNRLNTQDRIWAWAFNSGELRKICEDIQPCDPKKQNTNENNAYFLSYFTERYYRSRIGSYFKIGQLWNGYSRAHRLRKLIAYEDLPLQSKTTAGAFANKQLGLDQIAAAMFDDPQLWRNGSLVDSHLVLLAYADSPDNKQGLLIDDQLFATGLDKIRLGCPADAYPIFQKLLLNSRNSSQRELFSYLALRAIFTTRFRQSGDVSVDGSWGEARDRSDSGEKTCTSNVIKVVPSAWEKLENYLVSTGMKSDAVEMRETVKWK